MQIKKEEIRTTILNAAQQEFLIHGYEGSSLRVIAKKSKHNHWKYLSLF